jgi:DNA-binding MarR family transcriptional regulator
MTKWIDKQSPEFRHKLHDRVVRMLARLQRPVFLGEIAIEIGVSLSQAESAIKRMVMAGLVRPATPQEISRVNGRSDAVVYALVKVVLPSP